MNLRGKVVSGLGQGAKFFLIGQYLSGFEKLLGENPFAGTLNVDVEEGTIELFEKIKADADLVVRGFVFEGKEYFEVKCIHARLNGIKGLLVFPKINHHPKNILEFVCSRNLRKEFGLVDGELVELEI